MSNSDPMIFVFGSNELGIHGRGAAKEALDNYEARYGQGFGLQGRSFAIPTCSRPCIGDRSQFEISTESLQFYIDCFIAYALNHPGKKFKITQIGCGLAGWEPEVVADLFYFAPENCYFDLKWKDYLPEHAQFWGTHEEKHGDRSPAAGDIRRTVGHA